MSTAIQLIADYVRSHSPRAAEPGVDVAALPVHKILDSIAMMDFIAYLERTFRIRISDADVLPQNFETFAAVARLVERKGAGA